ncbi:MAG: stage V sporulation protein AC [Clostridia bacterium]|jgi:stage V sporulation protein AC|nr:stage V sporulation protein AC [Clostridia bacterium]
MSKSKKKKFTPIQQEFQDFAKDLTPKRPVLKNCFRAFIVGGSICILGQLLQWFFIKYFNFTEKTAGDPAVAVLIILSIILTGLGVFDHIGQWAGAGTAIPITGFANTMASAAIEHRTEGYVLGVGGNMFKLSGAVIVYGTVAAFFVAIITLIIRGLGGI